MKHTKNRILQGLLKNCCTSKHVFFLIFNYCFISCLDASEARTLDSGTTHTTKQQQSSSPLTPSLEVQKVASKIVKSTIPLKFFKIAPEGIYLQNNLGSQEKDITIEAVGNIFVRKLNFSENLTIKTTGSVYFFDDVSIGGSIAVYANEIDVLTKLKTQGPIKFLAQNILNIRGYISSKSLLQLVGIEKVTITGMAKTRQSIVVLSGGKIEQQGRFVAGQEIAINGNDYNQQGMLVSKQGIRITSKELLKLEKGSSIAAKDLILSSSSNQIEVLGDVYTEGQTTISSPDRVTLIGNVRSDGVVSVKGKDFYLTGLLIGRKGLVLAIENEWKQQGICKAFGNGLSGKVGKLTNEGDIETFGINLLVEIGENKGSIRTRGHYALKGNAFTNHRGSCTFTTGVHQFDFNDDYMDYGSLYTPTLLIGKARHIKLLEGHQSYLKDALFSSAIQITVNNGVQFRLFGPKVFLQFASEGSATFNGAAFHDSTAQFPLLKYCSPFSDQELVSKKISIKSALQPVQENELRSEVENIAISHPWRNLKKGSGMTVTVRGDVHYAGVAKLESGPLSIGAGRSIQSEKGTMQAGYFPGDSLSLASAHMKLDKTTIQAYFDKVTVSVAQKLSLNDVALSAGMDALITSLTLEMNKSTLTSNKASVQAYVGKTAYMKDSGLKSHTHTTIHAHDMTMTNTDVRAGTQMSLIAEDQLALQQSSVEAQQAIIASHDMRVQALSLKVPGESALTAKGQLDVDGLTSTGPVSMASGETTNLRGNIAAQALTSQAKKTVNEANIAAEGTVQVLATAVVQNKRMEGETVYIQTDDFKDTESSKIIAKKIRLINEKGKGFNGQLEGDTVVIQMEDFQLTALNQVVANLTQLHINTDVVINQDLVLKNTLHLWANKLINRSKLTVHGDFVAQVNKDIQLYGQADIKGLAGFIAEEGIAIDRGRLCAERIFLQSKKGHISLDHALLKATMDAKITAEMGSIKKKATQIQAGTDVLLIAARNIYASSTVVSVDGEDKKEEDSIKAGNNIEMKAGGNVVMTGVANQAGANYTVDAGGNILDIPLSLEHERSQGNSTNNRFDHGVAQDPSRHKAGETLLWHSKGNQDLYGSLIEAKKVFLSSDKNVTAHETHYSQEHRSNEESDGGFFGEKRKKNMYSFSALSKGVQIHATESVEITSGKDITLTNIKIDSPKIDLNAVAGAVRILLGKNQLTSSSQEQSSNILWQKQETHHEEHTTYSASEFKGSLHIHSKQTFVEEIRGHIPSFVKMLEAQGVQVISVYLDESHKSETKITQGPSAALAIVVVLAVTICTAGTGASIGAAAAGAVGASGAVGAVITGMTAAAFTSLCSQAALALLANEGDLIKAIESLASTKTLENLGIAMFTGGVTAGLSSALHIPQGAGVTKPLDHIGRQAVQTTVNTTASIITGERPEDALVHALKAAAVGAVAGIAATEIGKAYFDHKVDVIGHKFLHALVGGASGALLSENPLEGMLAGAFGAAAAEAIGELVLMNSHKIAGDVVRELDTRDIPITKENVNGAIMNELKSKTDFAKLLTSGIALLTGQNVSIATFAANTAIDNNLSQMAFQLTELQVYEILARENIAMYKATIGEAIIRTLDFLIGDKETADSIQAIDDPLTDAIGGVFASKGLSAIKAVSGKVNTAVVAEVAKGTSSFELAKGVSSAAHPREKAFHALDANHPGKAIVEDMKEVFRTTKPGKERADKFADQVLQKHLGDGYIIEKPKKGSDLYFYSQKRDKQIRFDVTNSHGDKPHINVEIWEQTNGFPGDRGQRYRIDGGNIHVYLEDK